MPRVAASCLAAGAGWLLACAAAATVLAPTIVTDELASPGAGCSLREAVLQANRNVVVDPACGEAGEPGALDTIVLAPAVTYLLSLAGEDDLGESGDLDIENDAAAEDLAILGNGAALAAHELLADRLLDVRSGARVHLQSLTIRGGRVSNPVAAQGGGLRSAGHLSLVGCTVRDNRVTGGSASGGGIASGDRLELSDCVVRDNVAIGIHVGGGGISAFHGRGTLVSDLVLVRTHVVGNLARGLPGSGAFVQGGGVSSAIPVVEDSWFEGNVAEGGSGPPGQLGGIVFGGGLMAGLATVSGTTFSANVARGGDGGAGAKTPGGAAHAIGGAILIHFGAATIANSTFSGNSTLPGAGRDPERALRESVGAIFVIGTATLDSVTVTGSSAAGIYNGGGRMTLTNSLVALQSGGGDCAGGPITSADFNLDSDGSCGLVGPNDQPAVAAVAVGLAPLAHNGGFAPTHLLQPWSAALDRGETALEQDQRGVARPQRAGDDVGAVEQDTFLVADIPSVSRSTLPVLAAALAFAALALLRRMSG